MDDETYTWLFPALESADDEESDIDDYQLTTIYCELPPPPTT